MTEPTQQPTQVQYPGRAAARTAAATLPPALVLLPALVDRLGPEWAAVVFVCVTLVPAALTRLMGSPTFDALLAVILPMLAAQPKGKKCDPPQT